jgi:hypothetical protein
MIGEMPAGYDAWKTTDPRDYLPEPPCDHEKVEPDGYDGWGRCIVCGEQMQMDPWEFADWRVNDQWFDEMCRREEARQWWADRRRRVNRAARKFLYRITGGWVPERKRIRILHDEDIPF